MFIRNRKKPLPLRKKDAVINRLPTGHPKLPLLRKKAAQAQKGYNGERKLDYHLKSLPDAFVILNDVTLDVFGKKFQIDSLIITPHSIYITEVKSVDGTITFNTNLKQFIQNNGEKLEGYRYPITQVENIQFNLLRWLQNRKLDGLPIYYFIAFSEQSTICNVIGNEDAIRKVVSYVDEIPLRIMKMDDQLKQARSGNKQLKNRIIQAIMNECEDFDFDVFRKYGIDKSEILPGVRCPECGVLGMKRLRHKWRCEKCGACSRNAHLAALSDYALLTHHEIRNKQCRKFLMVNNRGTAHTILKRSGITLMKGTKTWRLKSP